MHRIVLSVCILEFAFVRSHVHFKALKQCLKAIEEDDPMLATTIDQILVRIEHVMLFILHMTNLFMQHRMNL